ncbi:acyl-CoA carboxylase subunit beta [Verminephrobacter eiseniae]|uniref:Propionyl-CoA carboxylase n=1 Tax=Verminephrobacter eiseniae (strain EF01-2) TaxID=391735 RepID=A1WJ43_VEREI|nr:carboxyl transferase domain-containing protein [Verminephrobacter eiseniae]ABM57650.1 Propionyl-CoA carboxylase [Verminephrobacter eiseniae EF01-2]MCW5283268.1 acyl-CoA carboxylase subunit beta [Verminephrobacter eiseniae]MCW5303584.1 acyl-CoA carboxylase subunit beta [Verminephrobacter eiseniae]MCW8180001.1 acyl-CoA carboxylase subunit beta [Verminephrobacter eiseniae]MCW8188378.1 acyl-CoA carboxylase subunit beta [Verminephrobacter eiseniae]
MAAFACRFNAATAQAQARRAALLARLATLHALHERAAAASARAQAQFDQRGQLLPRQRVALLLDAGAPWLPLAALAGYLQDIPDPQQSVPGGGQIAGIGVVAGVRCMVLASDSGIEAGAMQPMGLEKILRVQQIALQNRLPFVHLVESAGANLMRYRVEGFVHGGRLFRNLARLSAAGIPVITVLHGSGTAGGAYMPGLSDVVIMVRGRSRAFLAGPPLLAAATGERATEEELGGADMHTTLSGLGEYLAQDDRHAIGLARELLAATGWGRQRQAPGHGAEPLLPADDLLALMPEDLRQPVDMRAVIARLVDGSELLEFKARHGAATVCAQARIAGHPVGLVSNNGPIDVAGANKATHFIQWMCQLGQPLIYLQNTTGYMVGKDSEQGGMIKHGSKMLQAVTQATVPQLTIQCGASFGAGNYGMCGRGFAPRFLFSWPGAKTAVMGGEQAARTMQIVTDAALARKGRVPDAAQSQARFEQIVARFETQADALYTSGLLLDDGVIDPRDTRAVLALCLTTIAEGAARTLRPLQFGVARM